MLQRATLFALHDAEQPCMTEEITVKKNGSNARSLPPFISLGSPGYIHPPSLHCMLYVCVSVCMYVLYIDMIGTHCVQAKLHVPSSS